MSPNDDGLAPARQAADQGATSACAASPSPSVLVVDADPALAGLLGEWLADCGCHVHGDRASEAQRHERFDLVVVDVPFPRQGGLAALGRLIEQHPGTPVLALSPAFFAGTAGQGALARKLGVAGVLAKPVTREALTAAAARLLPRRP